MKRKIIHINEARCNGCGACAAACHEGAISMVNGKAVLTREDYCDGLGDCLPACPTGAITFEEREAPAYVDPRREAPAPAAPCACPGSASRTMPQAPSQSALQNWPVQIKLASPAAAFFDNADLLIAADCTAFSYADFHAAFLQGRALLVGCPKLDAVDYSEKLGEVMAQHTLRSITLLRMEVPCCGGLEMALRRALQKSGKQVAARVLTISIEGKILSEVAL